LSLFIDHINYYYLKQLLNLISLSSIVLLMNIITMY